MAQRPDAARAQTRGNPPRAELRASRGRLWSESGERPGASGPCLRIAFGRGLAGSVRTPARRQLRAPARTLAPERACAPGAGVARSGAPTWHAADGPFEY